MSGIPNLKIVCLPWVHDIKNRIKELPQEIIEDHGIIDNTVWIWDHKNQTSRYGIIPTYLNELFEHRKRVKIGIAVNNAKADAIREHLELEHSKDEFALG